MRYKPRLRTILLFSSKSSEHRAEYGMAEYVIRCTEYTLYTDAVYNRVRDMRTVYANMRIWQYTDGIDFDGILAVVSPMKLTVGCGIAV